MVSPVRIRVPPLKTYLENRGRLLYLDGSGHNAYQDKTRRYMAKVHACLLGRASPERPYQGHRMPDDYGGQHEHGLKRAANASSSLPQVRRANDFSA